MIGQMAIAIALPGFNGLGRSVTNIFFSMDHLLIIIYVLRENEKKSIDGSRHHQISLSELFVLLYDGFKCLFQG